MKVSLVVTALVSGVFLVGGCQQQEQQANAVSGDVPAVAPSATLPSDTLTLSVEQLELLDWSRPLAGRPKVVDTRLVDGVGVEFDIQFPGNGPRACSIDYVSSGSGGYGAMVGLDVRGYEEFALRFALVSVNGSDASALPHEVVVGALIGPTADGKLSTYEPLALAFSSNRKAGVAKTPLQATQIRQIGIHAHMANPEVWSPDGTVLTLRVEPVSNATVLDSAPVFEEKARRKGGPSRGATDSPDMGPARLGTW